MLNHQPAAAVRLERVAMAGVIALAVGSFVLSYDALHELAVTNQVPRPLAWIWPLIVDGFIITASVAVLHAVFTGRRGRYPWLLVVGFSMTSIAFNVLHSPPAPVARLVAAIPPLTLVLSFELLMRQLRARLERADTTCPATSNSEGATVLSVTADRGVRELAAGRGRLASEAPAPSMLERARELHRQHVQQGVRLTGKALGATLGISDGYARRLLRELNLASGP